MVKALSNKENPKYTDKEGYLYLNIGSFKRNEYTPGTQEKSPKEEIGKRKQRRQEEELIEKGMKEGINEVEQRRNKYQQNHEKEKRIWRMNWNEVNLLIHSMRGTGNFNHGILK